MREGTQRIYKTVSSIKEKAPSFFFPAKGKRYFAALQALLQSVGGGINPADERNALSVFENNFRKSKIR